MTRGREEGLEAERRDGRSPDPPAREREREGRWSEKVYIQTVSGGSRLLLLTSRSSVGPPFQSSGCFRSLSLPFNPHPLFNLDSPTPRCSDLWPAPGFERGESVIDTEGILPHSFTRLVRDVRREP